MFKISNGRKMGFFTTPFCANINKLGGRIYVPKPAYAIHMDILGSLLNEFQYIDEGGYFDHRSKEKSFTSKNRKKYHPK